MSKILVIGDGMRDVFHDVLDNSPDPDLRRVSVSTHVVLGGAARVGLHVRNILSCPVLEQPKIELMLLCPEIRTSKTYVLAGSEVMLRLDEDSPSSFNYQIDAMNKECAEECGRSGRPLVVVISDYAKGAISLQHVEALACLGDDVTYVINTKQPWLYDEFAEKQKTVFVCNEEEYEKKFENYERFERVVETRAERGAVLRLRAEELLHIPNPPQPSDGFFRSSTGAGDSFVAALAVQLAAVPGTLSLASLSKHVETAVVYSAATVCAPPWQMPTEEWTLSYAEKLVRFKDREDIVSL